MLQTCRRRFLLTLASGLAGLPSLSAQTEDANYTSTADITSWMDGAGFTTKAVENPLHLFRFRDPIYCLTKPIAWKPNPGEPAKLPRVEVPAGFVTDFTSVPRLFWTLLPRDGSYAFAAIIHDYLYWEQKTTRAAADQILDLAMGDLKINVVSRGAIYAGVQAGGTWSWNANAKLKSGGEKRLLVKFPDDPLVTWAEWKKRPGVFG